MEEHIGAILTFKVTHVAKSAPSPSMEPDGCDCAIRDLLAYGVNIGVIGTDKFHSGSIVSKTFPWITHQFDVYHFEKSLRIKLSNKACCERGGFEVYAGIKAIINLWYSCQNCDRDPDILR